MPETIQPEEGKETEIGDVDFVEVFKARLAEIAPAAEYRGYFQFPQSLQKVGISSITKFAPALAFHAVSKPNRTKDTERNIWIGNPAECKFTQYPHDVVHDELNSFLREHDYKETVGMATYIYQDNVSGLYIVFEDIANEIRYMENELDNDYSRESWLGLAHRYNIKMIIGVSNIHSDHAKVILDLSNKIKPEVLSTDVDIVGDTRLENAYKKYADDYHMNNTQFLRFRALARSYFDAGQPINWDELAEEVVNQDKNH